MPMRFCRRFKVVIQLTEEVLRVELDHLKADVGEIKDKVTRMDDTLTQIQIELAGQKTRLGIFSAGVGAMVGAIVSAWFTHK